MNYTQIFSRRITFQLTVGITLLALVAALAGEWRAQAERGLSRSYAAAPVKAANATALFATITVNSTADDNVVNGNCTLREAITAANTNAAVDACAAGAAGLDAIVFNLGAGTPSIAVTSALPTITDPVTINGNTGGSTRVELNGAGAGSGDGLTIVAGGSTIEGMVINRFVGIIGTSAGIVIGTNGGNTVKNCYLGTDVTGTVDLGNSTGVYINASNNTIGGTTAAERNVISGNRRGVDIISGGDATANKVSGNYIGTDVNGTTDLGNSAIGVLVQEARNNTIGGTTAGERNVISSNHVGVVIAEPSASGNKVIGNYIGTDVNGSAVLGNNLAGVVVADGANNTIGGMTAAERNVISGNDGYGLVITGATAISNAILGNSIFNNSDLGIDLGDDGVTSNDASDADASPNKLQNFPVITNASPTTITGMLDSLPANATYPVRLEFFANAACDASGNGEGEVFLGATSLAAPGAFAFNYTFVTSKPFITATATDAAGNTSEFSACVNASQSSTPVVALTDPISCTESGNVLTVTVSVNNSAPFQQAVTLAVTALPIGLLGLSGSGTATVGAAPTMTATSVNYGTTLSAGQSATLTYRVQVTDAVASGTQLCITTTSTFNGAAGPNVTACGAANCPPVGPGAKWPATSIISSQQAGSVLIYNVYTSAAGNAGSQNTRLSMTNTHISRAAYVHLFFVDGTSCSVADSYICLTPNQTASFLASDLDPGTTGYVVAVATDRNGCPTPFNYLIGDEYVKFASGHAANLGAEAVSALALGNVPVCNGDAVQLNFDGLSYNLLPRVLAVSNMPSAADGNSGMVIVNRIGGNLGTGAAALGPIFGIQYDDAESSLSFGVTGSSCQISAVLSNKTIRGFNNSAQSGRSNWMKFWQTTDEAAMTGAFINHNTLNSGNAFSQGHNLHILRLTDKATLTVPMFPPSC